MYSAACKELKGNYVEIKKKKKTQNLHLPRNQSQNVCTPEHDAPTHTQMHDATYVTQHLFSDRSHSNNMYSICLTYPMAVQ